MKKVLAVILVLAFTISCTGCKEGVSRSNPVTLTIWHVYGEQTASPLNDIISEFNDTIGQQEGIKVQVSLVSNTNMIHEAVLKAANKEPGAAELPDLFISYPKTVLAMPNPDVLMDFRDCFSEEELDGYVSAFIEEGEINGKLLVFPVAKSTEILFVNNTLFDRFAKATGAEISDLNTWEGLFETSLKYKDWSGGKTFIAHDYHFNYFQVGCESMGEDFFDGEKIAFGPKFEKAWEPYARSAIEGGLWLNEGYATEPLRTGDAIASVGSSASVLYYADEVTYADNKTEKVEISAYPVPCFENGKKLVMQRGAGICGVKSTPEREKAMATFVKWLTSPEVNVRFVTSVGYMPVTEKGFELLPNEIEKLESPKYKSLYNAYIQTQKDYEFYSAPKFDSYLDLETTFEKEVRRLLRKAALEYKEEEKEDSSVKNREYLIKFERDMNRN